MSIIYNDSKILDHAIRNRHYIPYHIKKNEKYRENKNYFNYYWNMCFKVIEANYNSKDELEYIYARCKNHTYHVISSDLYYQDFLLIKDNRKIYKDNIINSNKKYTGAEIIYWFYVNNIDLENKRFNEFNKFLSSNSNFRLSDENMYTISANIKDNIFTNVMIKRCK